MTTKTIPLTELRDAGYLQEANRQFFHPLGLALTIDINAGTMFVQDWRDIDGEGGFFTEAELNNPEAEQKAMAVAHELGQRSAVRIDVCGAVIQSIPTSLRTWATITAPDPTGRKTQIRTIVARNTPTPPDDATITRESWEKASDGTWERTILEWEPPATETIDLTAPTTPDTADQRK